MLIVFLLQGNAILLFEIIKKNNLFFTIWIKFWNMNRIWFFFFSIQNVKSNCYIIFSQFFPIIFFWWKIYSFPAIFFVKALLFVILCGSFLISSWFSATVTEYWKNICLIYWWDLLLLFLSSQEDLYMTHHDSNLFYDIYNIIN